MPWLGVLLSACENPPVAPLKIGMNPWVGYDPLVLARDTGLLDARRVKVVELPSGSEVLRQFRNGVLEAAALTLDEVLCLADEHVDVRVVAVLSVSAGADAVLAAPSLRRAADLRGRRVAVERTTVGALMLQGVLAAGGLRPDDVQVLNLEAIQHLAALQAGRVDAAVSYEPLAGAMRAAGFQSIFDSRQMDGDIVDVLVAHTPLFEQRPQDLLALFNGWRQGLLSMQRSPVLSADLLVRGTGLSLADYLAAFRGLRFYSREENLTLMSGQPPPLGAQSQRLVQTLQAMGRLRQLPDWSRLIDVGWMTRLSGLEAQA